MNTKTSIFNIAEKQNIVTSRHLKYIICKSNKVLLCHMVCLTRQLTICKVDGTLGFS